MSGASMRGGLFSHSEQVIVDRCRSILKTCEPQAYHSLEAVQQRYQRGQQSVRSRIVAKADAFGLLRELCSSSRQVAELGRELQQAWEYAVCSLLVEDVYQAIVEQTGLYPLQLRQQALMGLERLSEDLTEGVEARYTELLIGLWRVRNQVAPVLGTPIGTMEMMRLSRLLAEPWHGFFAEQGKNLETIYAVEEFVFDLSYEQIVMARERMVDTGVVVVGRARVSELLGRDSGPQDLANGGTDPRLLYGRFLKRSRTCSRRTAAGAAGPHRSLEELLLVHLLQHMGGLAGFTQNSQHKAARTTMVSVLTQINTLPGSQEKAPVGHRQRDGVAKQ